MSIGIIIMIIFCSFVLIVSLLLCLSGYKKLKAAEAKKEQALAIEITRKNEQDQLNAELTRNQDELKKINIEIENLNSLKERCENKAKEARDNLQEEIDNFKKRSNEAAENYFEVLEKSYDSKEAEIKKKTDKINQDLNKIQKELDKYKQMRAAAREVVQKEEEIKKNFKDYSLQPSESDLQDIKILNNVKQKLTKPRILSMLIWQTYWQPLAKKQFPQILGTNTIIGIYKITNQLTNECYIGQSVDVDKRWKEHIKCGLGIDTPVGNKLYKAMAEYGIENFTFELIEKCSKEDLDIKEKYFIELYEANNFGYNGQKGNK